ncbi:hypothetical protein Tco_0518717, partial [Tanacetum coccineum]
MYHRNALRISPSKRKEGNLNFGLIDKYPTGDLSHITPTAPATANAAGG